MRLTRPLVLSLTLMLAACATTSEECSCDAFVPATVVDAVPTALYAICSISPAGRTDESLRADAGESGFHYLGEFFEFSNDDGTVDVRPGATAGERCELELMVDHDQGEAVDRAFDGWARDQGMSLTAPDGDIDGVGRRDRRGPDGSTLSWSYTPSMVEDEPAVIVATLDLAVED